MGWRVLVRSDGRVEKNLVTRELEVYFSSQDGRESPVRCVSYTTTMTSRRPRTDWCPVIFYTWRL